MALSRERVRRYALLKQRGPVAAFMQQMSEIDLMVSKKAGDRTDEITGELKAAAAVKIQQATEALLSELKQRGDALVEEFRAAWNAKIESLPQIKGDAGYTPQKGKDYFDGSPGIDGDTPAADVDYPSIASVEGMIASAMKGCYEQLQKAGMSREETLKAIADGFADIPAAPLARALEKLSGKDRLDYLALKNRPGIDVAKEHEKAHGIHRGGSSKQTYYYDLSSLCDGVAKTFVIPANTRVVGAFCTDAPSGILRPLVDWTGTGTQLLTLTSQVAAPSQGATLYILYVV